MSQETEIEVNWEDQQKINQFSKLNGRRDRLQTTIARLETDLEAFKDAATEVENLVLMEEVESVPYRVGDAFFLVDGEAVQDLLTKDTEAAEKQLDETKAKLDLVKDEMKDLKTKLYSKFGTAINLEYD
jgi:prefoldin subunit 4